MREKKISQLFFYVFWVMLYLAICPFPVSAEDANPDSVSESEKSEEVFNLNEVVVTGTRTPYSLKEVPVPTVVVTEKDIDDLSAQTVSDVLRQIPGLFVVSEDIPGISSWRAKIRGLDFNSGYGLVLINGQRIKGGGMGEYGYGVNQVPLSLIKRIEVVKGPSSVLYGSDALAGVINIITKKCPDDYLYGMELAGGSEDTRTGSIYAGARQGDFGAFMNASVRESGIGAYGTRSSRDEEYSENRVDTTLCYTISPKVDARLDLSVEDQDRTRNYKAKDVVRHEWNKKYRIAPAFNFYIDDTSSAAISGYYYQWEMNEMESGADSSGFTPTIGDMFYRNAEARYTRLFADLFQFTVGADFLQEELDYNMADETIDNYSSYTQLETDFHDWMTLVLGARFDDHSEYGDYFSPKLSLMVVPFSDTRIRASVGKGFKSPTIRQLYYTALYQHGTYWYRSNPDLEAEESVGYSLDWEQGVGDRILFNMGVFRNDIDDKVLQYDTGEYYEGLPIVSYENVAKAYTQGLEVSLKAVIANGLTGTLAYTYTDTEDEDTGNELTYIPSNNVVCGLVYKYLPWGLSTGINVEYADEMYTDTENTEKADAYTLVDAKISKQFGEYYTLSLEGNNLFDSDFGQPDREWLGPTYLVKFKMDL